jgi:hypothetical protein
MPPWDGAGMSRWVIRWRCPWPSLLPDAT